MLQQVQGIDLLLEFGKLFQTEGDIPAFALLLAAALSLIIGCFIQFFIQFRDVNILSLDALQCFFVLGLMILDFLHQILIRSDGHFPIILLHLNQLPLRLHQLLMFSELLLSQSFIILHKFLHLGFQFIDHFQILSRIAHLLRILHQLLNVLFPLLHDLLLRLHLRLQIINLRILLSDDPLQIHDSLQSHLVGFLALVILDCLLKPLDHLIGVLQLQILRFEINRMAVLIVFSFQFVRCGLVQLLIQTDGEFLQLSPEFLVLLVEASGVLDHGMGDGRRRGLRGPLLDLSGDGAGDAALLLEAVVAALWFLFLAGEVTVRHAPLINNIDDEEY